MSDAIARVRETGLVESALHVPSPNCDQRPAHERIELLVIHNISLPPGVFEGDAVVDLFTNRLDASAHPFFATIADLRVSAHLLVRRDGALLQFVPFHLRAWHAGVSQWEGRERCNDFSIGIELAGTDDQPFTTAQYARLIGVAQVLQRAYPLRAALGHSEIASGRKTDPGPCFDWPLFRAATGLR